jgi:hypothetical protein
VIEPAEIVLKERIDLESVAGGVHRTFVPRQRLARGNSGLGWDADLSSPEQERGPATSRAWSLVFGVWEGFRGDGRAGRVEKEGCCVFGVDAVLPATSLDKTGHLRFLFYSNPFIYISLYLCPL